MKYVFDEIQKIKKKWIASDHRMLFLDFDGTLTPVVKDPASSFLDKETENILSEIALREVISLSIISGRALSDLKKRAYINGAYLAGCHGLEVKGKGFNFSHPDVAKNWNLLMRIAERLKRRYSSIKGVLIENKELEIAVHYRNVREREIQLVRDGIKDIQEYYKEKIEIGFGKKVFEIKPKTDWDKGSCVRMLMLVIKAGLPKGMSVLPVYIGDDKPDEPAFKVVSKNGVSIAVGENSKPFLKAEYFLMNTEDVKNFLKFILRMK